MKILKVSISSRFAATVFLVILLLFLLPGITRQAPVSLELYSIWGGLPVLAFSLESNLRNNDVLKNAPIIIPHVDSPWPHGNQYQEAQTDWLRILLPEIDRGSNMLQYHEIPYLQSYLGNSETFTWRHVAFPISFPVSHQNTVASIIVLPTEMGQSFLPRMFNSAFTSTPALKHVVPPQANSSPDRTTQHDRRYWLLLAALVGSWGIIFVLVVFLFAARRKGRSLTSIVKNMVSPEDYQTLGNIAMEQGEFPLAEKCYRKVIEVEPYNQEIHHEFGMFLFQTERYPEAIKEFHLALKSAIITPETYTYLACAYQKIGQPDKAEKYHHKALEFVPEDVSLSSVQDTIRFQKRSDMAHQHQHQKISS